MTQTPNLSLPYISASQAQKHITHNEAIRKLDVLVQLFVKDRDLNVPPASPTNGQVFIVAPGATNEWSTHEGELAAFQEGSWEFYSPNEGTIAWLEDEQKAIVRKNDNWEDLVEASTNFDKIGINGTADLTNRLLVNSQYSLFNHEGNGHQLKINKYTSSETASILFQSNYIGHAEIGLAGDNNLHVKTSSDGTNWKEAIIIDATSAEVSFPATAPLTNLAVFNLLGDGGRFAGTPEPKGLSATAFVAPSYFVPYNGSSLTQGSKYIHNNINFGGTAGTMAPEIEQLVQKMRPGAPANILRYGPEFFSLNIIAGSGTAASITVSGNTYYLNMVTKAIPIPQNVTLNFWLYVSSGSCALSPTGSNLLFIDGVAKQSATIIDNSSGWVQVTRRVSYDVANFVGYDTNITRIYQEPGSQILIASPILYPGHLPIDPTRIYGVVGSLTAWE